MQLYDLKETKERVILVGVQADDNEDTEKSLDELEELAQTAGPRQLDGSSRTGSRSTLALTSARENWMKLKISSGRQMPLESFVMMSSLLHNLEISRMHWIRKSWIAL